MKRALGMTFAVLAMAAIAWGSNRQMHRKMWDKAVAWPTLSPEDISDLVAYLNYVSQK